MDFYYFYAGKEFEAYNWLGAHPDHHGTTFRTYAPNARNIYVTGDFNNWQKTPMNRVYDGKFFEVRVGNTKPMDLYKYQIEQADGRIVDHCDPYGFSAELRPGWASRIVDLTKYHWHDDKWMRNATTHKDKPMNIYEMHMGSWKKKDDAKEDGWYRYDELAPLLIPYLEENGYNYVEFMPLNEYPSDQSWGYQATGFYAPTSRYGTPDQLRTLIDALHQNGIGVFLDIVLVHFAVNDYALANYDGTPLYEYPYSDMTKSQWGSNNFMLSRPEVRSFLQSACDYWISQYHFDGLRMDAVGNLLYWQGDVSRGENRAAIEFLKEMNQELRVRHPAIILMAEDSTTYPHDTDPVSKGGLGFDYKWDMGWMNDTLKYFASDPAYRRDIYHKLTFRQSYAGSDHFILPLSHDEVVHGKATIVNKMCDLYEGKFDQARALYLYMYTLPGKKLSFMGNEIGQLREWDEKREQDWDMLKYPIHDAFHHYMMKLNQIYLENSALWEWDYDERGFQWIDADKVNECIYAYRRMSSKQTIVFVMNCGALANRYTWRTGAKIKLLLASDEECWHGHTDFREKENAPLVANGTCTITIPGKSARIYLEY
ncbi:MAG: 1,4-alpha-glucan branching protein GlgB [Erysipelotrichaceae bacterium]|jgi:1,4-alpha-glucan branching enzyme|nr:1,4-alpha-glucan branching protein GlgB [Erysipelotrichaceae bacterium]MCI1327114.1 1,4-alpha-glucan branching protein GlgB [Solobacterium sp.]MCH4044271.1 1,4-alpha-glucan branching protein GlgB [Erysipelotrichaceae bacterium]MCH4121485.1 1,4-alpha-glucan branching protein GlgB [Erysipelotrichaceae bacterium]MCI1363797.1 1,4-alpha-glucan branching protein GlgB [Solobacterium sp.]